MRVDIILTLVVCSVTLHGSVYGQSDNIKVDITCDNKLWFYADGHVIVNASTPGSSQWDVTKHVTIPADTKVYGIKCVDYHVVAGILAAFSDGTTTDNSWRCTNKKPQGDWLSADFNDSTWQPAYVIHKNNKPSTYWNMRSDISRQASWIWTKGWQGKDKTVYCRKMHSAPAEWGSWSAWSSCTGDCDTAIQTRTRKCSGDSCPGSNQETKKCVPTVQEEDCARCVLNAANIGYLASCDDVTKYYQCQEGVDGGYQLSLMSCPRCTIWDQAQLTCVRNTILDQCPESGESEVEEHVINFGSTCMKGALHFGVVSGDSTKYIMYNHGEGVEMNCARGTEFNLTQCACVYVDTTDTSQELLLPEMCINFETMTKANKWGFSEGSYWISNHGKDWTSKHVQVTTNDCVEGDKCGLFSGESYLSVDALANTFHNWKTFTISLWVKSSFHEVMGLLTNGLTANGCSSLPTVSMTTKYDDFIGHVAFKDRVAQVNGEVFSNTWNHVVLVRDVNSVVLYLNGRMAEKREIKGDLLPSQCPLLLGVGPNKTFFSGQMDMICLFKGAVTQEQASKEYFWRITSRGYTGAHVS